MPANMSYKSTKAEVQWLKSMLTCCWVFTSLFLLYVLLLSLQHVFFFLPNTFSRDTFFAFSMQNYKLLDTF